MTYNRLGSLICFGLLFLPLSACRNGKKDPTPPHPEPSIELSTTTKEMIVGEQFTLTATVSPPTSMPIKWSSSDSAVADVDNNGVVKALSSGSCTIIATAGNLSGKCTLTVKNAKVEFTTPLELFAEYNVDKPGTFASGNVQTAFGGLFRWADVKPTLCPAGYHIPEKEELFILSGQWDTDVHYPYPDLTWKIDRDTIETVKIAGKTYNLSTRYKGDGKDVCYGLRFKGEDNKYLSAYRWQVVFKGGSDEDGYRLITCLTVTARHLGAAGAGTSISDVAKAEYWSKNQAQDIVRFFPAAGYLDFQGDGSADSYVRGRYWSISERSEKGAWGFGFDENMVYVGNWIKTAGYSVRCVKDVVNN